MANVTTRKKPIVLDSKPRPRKEDVTKQGIISAIEECLKNHPEIAFTDVVITNKEKVVDFKIGEDEYSISLTKHRKAKG